MHDDELCFSSVPGDAQLMSTHSTLVMKKKVKRTEKKLNYPISNFFLLPANDMDFSAE